jgi:hypothetical protein
MRAPGSTPLMTVGEFYGVTVFLALLAAPIIAVLSFLVWPL